VAAISEAGGRLTVLTDQAGALRLRRINRVRTIPDKPNSRLQRYRLTDRGRQWLAQRGDGSRATN